MYRLAEPLSDRYQNRIGHGRAIYHLTNDPFHKYSQDKDSNLMRGKGAEPTLNMHSLPPQSTSDYKAPFKFPRIPK